MNGVTQPSRSGSLAARTRLIRGFMAQAYGRAVTMGGQILIVPVMVTRWGSAGYGEWVTLSAMALYITYANVGVPGAVKADMAMAHGEGGHERMRRSFQTCVIVITALSGLALGGFIAAIHLLPFQHLLNPRFMSLPEAELVATIFGIQVALLMLIGILEAALSSSGRYALADFLSSSRQLAEFAALLAAVGLFAQRPGSACLIYLVSTLVHFTVLLFAAIKAAPWIVRGPWAFHPGVIRRLLRPMLGVFAFSFGYYGMSIQAPRILLSAALGPDAVAVYAVTTMLMRIVRMPIAIIAHAPTMELSFAYGAGELARARAMMVAGMRVSFWLAIVLIPVVLVFGPAVVHVWTRGRLEAPLSLLFFSSLATAVFSLALPAQEALMSRGRLGDATFWMVAASVPLLLLNWSLIRVAGLGGAGIAMMLIDGAYAWLTIRHVVALFDMSNGALAAQLARPPTDFLRAEAGRLRAAWKRRTGKLALTASGT